MARPIYPHELTDPDFQWLISTYKESNPDAVTVEGTCLPVILIRSEIGPITPVEAPVPPTVVAPDVDDFIEDTDL